MTSRPARRADQVQRLNPTAAPGGVEDGGCDSSGDSSGDDGSGSPCGGRIVLAATPIGDFTDASPRLVAALQAADVIAAEDTRRLRRLASGVGVQLSARVVSYHDHNETARAEELIAAAVEGRQVLVLTDAGMPSVSDPGLAVVRAAIAADVPVTAIPGPSAVLTALALSGLPTDRFCFEGFLPRRAGQRQRALADLATERRTMVFFEAPHRVFETLQAMREAFDAERAAALCRELTKTHEQVLRASLGELVAELSDTPVLGEVTLVVAGAPAQASVAVADLTGQVQQLVEQGMRRKDAVAQVAQQHGVAKRDLYQASTAGTPGS